MMLIVEHKQATQLIENNQLLMKNTVIKTLTNSIYDRLNRYPSSSKEIDTNWRAMPLDFLAMQKGKWIFPYRFTGKDNNQPSSLWKSYGLTSELTNELPKNTTIETIQRLKALSKIKASLINNAPQLNQHIENYFSLVENYRLSPLEEVISGLSFLQLSSDSRWNSELIEIYLFESSTQLTSLTEYLFKQNSIFSESDINLTVKKIRALLEDANIYSGWFDQSALELWKTNPELVVATLQTHSLIQNQWISVKNSSGLVLFLPFAIEDELVLVKNTLVSQGILTKDDSILLNANQISETEDTIEKLPYQISRTIWDKQIKQQKYFFVIKIILSLIFIACLVILMSFIFYKNRKKMEYLKLQENFITLVSHELKTPLASMRIMLETLHKRNSKKLSIKDYPKRIINEVDRLWLMVDNLLSLNQIKSGEFALNIDRINLSKLVNRIFEKFKEQLPENLVLDNKLPEQCICMADAILFELVFINLFSNSIKYCNQPIVQIKISLNRHNNTILFADNGSGISPSNWENVFNQFYRESSSNTKPGTGIGLALCRQIMQLHKGDISIQKSDVTGTVWSIVRPQ